LLVPAAGRIYGDTTPFQPVIQMEDVYEYGADIDQYPIARVQIAGCTLTPDDYDGNVYIVERDGTEIGEVRVYYSEEKDMALLQKALAEALSDPEGFEDPDEADELGLDMSEQTAGSYAAVAVFLAGDETGYDNASGEPVNFEIIPAKLRVRAGIRSETVKYQTAGKAAESIWDSSVVCERINLKVDEEVDDPYMYEVIDSAVQSELLYLIDGKAVRGEETLTVCGTHSFQFGGRLLIDSELADQYEFSEYVFDPYPLIVYSDASLDADYKEHRGWYYGAPLSALPALFDYAYTPGRDNTEFLYDSIHFKVSADPEMEELYTEAEVPFIPAGNMVYYRAVGTNEKGEEVVSSVESDLIHARPVTGTAPDYHVERVNPLHPGKKPDFPYPETFRWDEAEFTFQAIEEFETDGENGSERWPLAYAGEPVTAEKLFETAYFSVNTNWIDISPYDPGRYEAYELDYTEKESGGNFYVDALNFAYEILPKYYYSYLVDGKLVGEFETVKGKPGEPLTYALKCDEELSVPKDKEIFGWSFYDSIRGERIAADDGSLSAETYESGLDGTYSFTDTDVTAVARLLSVQQGVRISDIEDTVFDGRAHVLTGMPADGKKTVADLDLWISDGDYTLVYGEDYTAKLFNNTNASSGLPANAPDSKRPRALITGKGDYKNLKATVYFTIRPYDISDFTYTMDPGFIYSDKSGNVRLGKRRVSGSFPDGRTVTLKASDYIESVDTPIPKRVTGDDPLAFYYIFSAEGKGNYTGYTSMRVPAEENAILFSTFKVKYNSSISYQGTLSKEDFGLRVYTPKGRELEAREYEIAFDQELTGPIESGYIRIILTPTGKLDYGDDSVVIGEKTLLVRVKGATLPKNKFKLDWSAAPFDGADRQNTVICSDSNLVENRDYKCEWKLDSNTKNKAVGTYTVTITGIGKYASRDKNGIPSAFQLSFKRGLSNAAGNNQLFAELKDQSADQSGATVGISVTVKNADGTETIYANQFRKGKWGNTLVSQDGIFGFSVTSWGKSNASGSRTVKIKCLPSSGFTGSITL
ncbi:MAG: hypothetical protein IJ873_01420, partial [Lachnospiraceae bacterium]|nr:hypothetical protein [Lachnospiraceae bacterium]